MSFIIDKQTLNDLNIFGKRGGSSVYALFNTTRTRGGAQILEEMFLCPLGDAERINKRAAIIDYCRRIRITFPFGGDLFDSIEHYLNNRDERTKISVENDTLQRKLKNYMGADTEYELLHKGILAFIQLVNQLREFLGKAEMAKCEAFREELTEMQRLISDERLAWVAQEKNTKRLDYAKSAEYDQLVRYVLNEEVMKLLQLIYYLDVYISVADVAVKRNFVLAKAVESDENRIQIEDMVHPLLKNPVGNSLSIDQQSNFIFLTGANMAGKSTFMKTFGICIFLAHMGFPVPAKRMDFSVQGGLFTTINLPDNLNMGYSHFYAEVLRVKKVAKEVAHSKHLVVVFDELFRGTNVKDAYDATVAVTEAFAENRNCTFMISTHIIEAGDTLKQRCDNINFVYLPTKLEGSKPIYTYQLTPGITNDRHGMMIINNERIIDILQKQGH